MKKCGSRNGGLSFPLQVVQELVFRGKVSRLAIKTSDENFQEIIHDLSTKYDINIQRDGRTFVCSERDRNKLREVLLQNKGRRVLIMYHPRWERMQKLIVEDNVEKKVNRWLLLLIGACLVGYGVISLFYLFTNS